MRLLGILAWHVIVRVIFSSSRICLLSRQLILHKIQAFPIGDVRVWECWNRVYPFWKHYQSSEFARRVKYDDLPPQWLTSTLTTPTPQIAKSTFRESWEFGYESYVCQGYFWFSDGVITFASQQELECWQMIDLIGCWYAIWIWETGVRIIRGLDILFKAGLQLGESKQLLPIYIDDENYAG
jgi:hypothetical protein